MRRIVTVFPLALAVLALISDAALAQSSMARPPTMAVQRAQTHTMPTPPTPGAQTAQPAEPQKSAAPPAATPAESKDAKDGKDAKR